MKTTSTPSNANYTNADGTRSYQTPDSGLATTGTSDGDNHPRLKEYGATDRAARGRDGFDPPATATSDTERALETGLSTGSKAAGVAGVALRVSGSLAAPSSYATAAEALRSSRLSDVLTTAGEHARVGGAVLAAGAGAVQIHDGYSRGDPADNMWGTLKIGAAAATFVNPGVALVLGLGIFIAERASAPGPGKAKTEP